MLKRTCFLGFLCVILLGFHKGNTSKALPKEPLYNRPLVAFVPIINHSKSTLQWDLSEELTGSIFDRLKQKNRLYLLDMDPISILSAKYLDKYDPFGNYDKLYVGFSGSDAEFVVFTELLTHRELSSLDSANPKPFDSSNPTRAELNLCVRIRIFDLREKTPKIILQEMIEQFHYIPKEFTEANTQIVSWKESNFDTTPLGIAHNQLCKEIASRIEDYIGLGVTGCL